MKIIMFLVLIVTFFSNVYAEELINEQLPSKEYCQKLKNNGASDDVIAKRGCCSWHGGICGCTSGRVVCCDNTYSPSCTCNKEELPTIVL